MQLDEAIRLAQHAQSTDFAAQLVAEVRNGVTEELARMAALLQARRLAEQVKAEMPLTEARTLNTQTRWDEAASRVREEEDRLAGIPMKGTNLPHERQQREGTLIVLRRAADDRRKEYEDASAYLKALRVLLDWHANLEQTWATAPTLRRILAELQG